MDTNRFTKNTNNRFGKAKPRYLTKHTEKFIECCCKDDECDKEECKEECKEEEKKQK